MEPLIACKDVSLGYENREVANGINLEVYPGDYLCIVGENGSGKSTLVKGLIGLIRPLKGQILVDPSLREESIGYLPQQTEAQKDFPATVYEVVLSGCLKRRGFLPFYSRKEKLLAEKNMEKLGIGEIAKQCYRELSGGQKQRVLLARALCVTDKLLILDEPVTGLDPSAMTEMYQLIRKLNEEDHVAIIMVSHDIMNILSQAKTILHLKQQPLFYGTVSDYKKSEVSMRFLGGEENSGND